MKLGILAKTFQATTPLAALDLARRAGYEAVQYNMACSGLGPLPPAITDAEADAVGAGSAETGVEICAISATYNMAHPDRAVREQGRRSFEAIAAAAHRMGCSLLTVCTGSRDSLDQWRYHPDNHGDEAWREMIVEFSLIARTADKHDILIGVEPELGNIVSLPERARRLLDSGAGERVRIVIDAANLFETETAERRKTLVEEAIDLLKDRIVLAHAKDRLADGRFAAAGNGVIDFAHYVSTLRKAGYDGPLITHGLAESDAKAVAAFLRRRIDAAEAEGTLL